MDLFFKRFFEVMSPSLLPRRQINALLKVCGSTLIDDLKLKRLADVMFFDEEAEVTDEYRHGKVPYITEMAIVEEIGLLLSASERMERIRGYLYAEETTVENWRKVCLELELWPRDVDLTPAIDYVQALGARWPDEVRVALPGWYRRVFAGHPEPRLKVVRHVDLLRLGVSYRDPQIVLTTDAGVDVMRYRNGRWGNKDLGPRGTGRFLEQLSPEITHLVWPECSGASLSVLLSGGKFPHLRHLDLGGDHSRTFSWISTAECRRLEQLFRDLSIRDSLVLPKPPPYHHGAPLAELLEKLQNEKKYKTYAAPEWSCPTKRE